MLTLKGYIFLYFVTEVLLMVFVMVTDDWTVRKFWDDLLMLNKIVLLPEKWFLFVFYPLSSLQALAKCKAQLSGWYFSSIPGAVDPQLHCHTFGAQWWIWGKFRGNKADEPLRYSQSKILTLRWVRTRLDRAIDQETMSCGTLMSGCTKPL